MNITVAIITRNRATQLKRCLNSLTNQTVNSFRVLIVDNGSTDNTEKTIESFSKKLKIKYYYEPRPGAPYARNKALGVIRGDIMATIDDDCEAFPNWIENIKKSHIKFPKALVIQGYAISQPKDGLISILAQFNHEVGIKDYLICKKDLSFHFSFEFLTKPNRILLIDAKNASFKLEMLKKMHVSFNESRKYADDFEFSRQILNKGASIIFDPSIVVYHWERESLKDFFSQRIKLATEVMNAQLNWPKKTFPKRRNFWWAGRVFKFFIYIVSKRYFTKSMILLLLFMSEKSLYMLSRYREYFRVRFKYYAIR